MCVNLKKFRTDVIDFLMDIENDKPFFTRAKAMAKVALVLALSYGIKD